MLKSHRSLCVAFSRKGAGLCIYHLLVWLNLSFLHISQWITLPTQSCLALYSLCANLLHSLIIWLIVSSLSPHSLHLLFCWVLSILALIWLVLMALSCAAIRRDYYYFFRVFHTFTSFSRVSVTASLFKFPGLFWVIWPSSPFWKPLGTVPSGPITIGITVNSMFPRFFSTGLNFHSLCCPVSWGCRIHRLLLYGGVKSPQLVSWIGH